MSENKNILVVEDDSDARLLLCMMLTSLGYKPIDFASGDEALAQAKDLNVRLAMLDIMMPGLNGYELLEELKKLENFEDVPVIMVTAKDKDDEVMAGYQLGADYYITKPYTVKQIEYALDLYL